MSETRLTRWQYAEVRAMCRQYQELKSEASLLLGPRGVNLNPAPHGGGTHGDPVAAIADRREKILARVALIEQVAHEVEGGRWARALILNTCYGVSWECLPPEIMPTSHRWDFFRARRAFYWRLWERHNLA